MNFESLNALSYRELQAKAKTFGIAANKKKEVLIELLIEQSEETASAPVEEEQISASSPEVAVIEQETIVPAVEIVETPVEEEQEEDEDVVDPEELNEMFSSMKLKGIPTPTGKKTVFKAADGQEDSEATNAKINWG